MSDGPSGQYKNFLQQLAKDLDLKWATWNYSAAGHGKGSADGIGATIKQTADAFVAQGHELPDFKTFVIKMVARMNVVLIAISNSEVLAAEALPKKMKAIQNTKKIHQVTWTSDKPQYVYLLQLTCVACDLEQACRHREVRRRH